jgi:Flp pilus assembly protein TadD
MNTDRRWRVLLIVVLAVVAGGGLVTGLPERARHLATPQKMALPEAAMPAYSGELHERFQQAAVMLHAGQNEYALTALQRVLELAPQMPEAHVNAGFALVELGQPALAADHFQTAIELRPGQANAYYGLALVYESVGDLASALGAMRTYAHLSSPDAPHRRRALAAIWEWQRQRDTPSGTERHSDGDAVKANGGVDS